MLSTSAAPGVGTSVAVLPPPVMLTRSHLAVNCWVGCSSQHIIAWSVVVAGASGGDVSASTSTKCVGIWLYTKSGPLTSVPLLSTVTMQHLPCSSPFVSRQHTITAEGPIAVTASRLSKVCKLKTCATSRPSLHSMLPPTADTRRHTKR